MEGNKKSKVNDEKLNWAAITALCLQSLFVPVSKEVYTHLENVSLLAVMEMMCQAFCILCICICLIIKLYDMNLLRAGR